MASKERSPNFPALTLQKALEYVSKFQAEARRTAVKTPIALQAMGYNSVNGRSLGTLAALKAYGLIATEGGNTQITELALRILVPKSDQDARLAKQQAALFPKLFKSIHEHSGDLSEKMLASALYHQKFTQEGATKAAQIFHQNRAFAGDQFDGDSENEGMDGEEDLDDLIPIENASTTAVVKIPPPLTASSTFQKPGNIEALLAIPLDIGDAFIPRGMSNDDFELLIDSLNLWKRKIVRANTPNESPSSTVGMDKESEA